MAGKLNVNNRVSFRFTPAHTNYVIILSTTRVIFVCSKKMYHLHLANEN